MRDRPVETTFETVRLTVDDGVATVWMNRPDKRNAFNLQMAEDIIAAYDAIDRDETLKLVMLRAEGPLFSAGADVTERKGKDVAWLRRARRLGAKAFAAVSDCAVPSVAAVQGACIGAGAEMSTACDFIVARDDARFMYPEGRIGSVGATQRLPRHVGKALAKELLFTARFMEADEALRVGYVNRVVPADRFEAELAALADQMRGSKALALRLIKKSIDLGGDTDFERGHAIEMLALERSLADTEWLQGVEEFAAERGARRAEKEIEQDRDGG